MAALAGSLRGVASLSRAHLPQDGAVDTGTKAVAAAAAVIAFAFALATFERWLARRRPQELAWAGALLLFTFGALALWLGASLGWAPWSFRLFYLFGAIANVPVLALGSVYLVDRRAGHALAAVLAIAVGFAAGVLATTHVGPIATDTLPQGSDVLGVLPRVLAATASAGGALAVFAIALWSIVRRQRVVGKRSAQQRARRDGRLRGDAHRRRRRAVRGLPRRERAASCPYVWPSSHRNVRLRTLPPIPCGSSSRNRIFVGHL
jgi:hypothetical protein